MQVAALTGKLNFDAAFNYKTTNDWPTKLKELAPDGINVLFENVGGKVGAAATLW